MAALAVLVASATDGAVLYARIDGVDRPDLHGTSGAEAAEALVADGWEPKVAVPVANAGDTVATSTAYTR